LGEEYRSFSSSLCSLLHSPVTPSLLGPNILLNTIFWNTLNFLSSWQLLRNWKCSCVWNEYSLFQIMYMFLLCTCKTRWHVVWDNTVSLMRGARSFTLRGRGWSAPTAKVQQCCPTRSLCIEHVQQRIAEVNVCT